jgi:cytochrome P450
LRELILEQNIVSVPAYVAQHSALNFKRPDEFVPERWLAEAQEEFATDKTQALVPFSFGPRNCLGKK